MPHLRTWSRNHSSFGTRPPRVPQRRGSGFGRQFSLPAHLVQKRLQRDANMKISTGYGIVIDDIHHLDRVAARIVAVSGMHFLNAPSSNIRDRRVSESRARVINLARQHAGPGNPGLRCCLMRR